MPRPAAGSRAAGGLYAYSNAAFGPFVGSFVGTLLWFANGALSNAAVAVLMVNGLSLAFPALGQPLGRNITLIVVYTCLAAINVRGLKLGLRVTEGITVLKLLPLILLAVVGLVTLHWSQIPVPHAARHGAARSRRSSCSPSRSWVSRRRCRRAPRSATRRGWCRAGLALALLGDHAAVLLAAARGAGCARRWSCDSHRCAARRDGRRGPWRLGSGADARGRGRVHGGRAPGRHALHARVLYAMGRDGLLPAGLGVVHPRFNTPAAAIITYCVVCAVLALSGTFKALAILAAAGTLVMYLVTAIAALVLRRREVNIGKPPFIIPGGPVVPVIAAVAIVAVLSTLAWRELAAIGVMLAASSVPFV